MLTEKEHGQFRPRKITDSGVALVVTLSMLVLAVVVVVAFFGRTVSNEQITSGSAKGVVATTFTDGAAQEIIGSLQKEMWDVSGQPTPAPSPSGAPTLFPMIEPASINPSRKFNPNIQATPSPAATSDPNGSYAQFANLVKQSCANVATYDKGTAPAVYLASSVLTSMPAVDGKLHDGSYWNQPQLVSVPPSDTAELSKLVPYWIYTARNGSHPTTYAANMAASSSSVAMSPTSVVGRYAYNVYDVGGLLNANVAGYGGGTPMQPNNSSKDALIIPGYKGSALMADLSGLALNGALTINGASASSISGLQSKLGSFRYNQTGSAAFAMLFRSGQYGGWLQPFFKQYDPAAAGSTGSLTSHGFTSRQDLITWINSQFPATTSGDRSPAAWLLPYLTHFSYDTDAPTYTPPAFNPKPTDPVRDGRPHDTRSVADGGNDAANLDHIINPGFNSPTTEAASPGAGQLNLCDSNGYPLVKRRFPLSALSVFDEIYPTKPPVSEELKNRIQYNFGLVWNTDYNCWDYKDWNEGTSIKKLSDVAAIIPSRSPNFFELLKAAITTGSLGKQWGSTYDNDPDLVKGNARYSAINFQIIQIGANIISQSTTNHFPTEIRFTDGGNDLHFYGIEDLPYFYRSRLMHGTVGTFSTKAHMHSMGTLGNNAYSRLCALMIQPELWNPHAPNALPMAASYPAAFRVVASTYTPVPIRTYNGSGPGVAWEQQTGLPKANALPGIVYGDFSGAGGPYVNQANYVGGATPNAYIRFSSAAPGGPPTLNTYREPVPLAAPNFPDNSVTCFPPSTATLAADGSNWDGKPSVQINVVGNSIPANFAPATSNIMLGFLMGYYCGGPQTGSSIGGYILSLVQVNPAAANPRQATRLQLQYSPDGANFFPYDYMSSPIPTVNGAGDVNAGIVDQQTEVGVRVDPRSQRWGNAWSRITAGNVEPYGSPNKGTLYPGVTGAPTSDLSSGQGSLRNIPSAPGWNINANNALGWLQINPGPGTKAYADGMTTGSYYADPDGVYRPADGAYASSGNVTGIPEAMVGVTGNSAAGLSSYDNRPVVLDRPFQSVAELGYVFRDTPWRSLDFISPQSADSALLDVFCVYGPDPWSYAAKNYNRANDQSTYLTTTGLSAGRVNLNTRQIPVLSALLKGAALTTPTSNPPAITALDGDQSTSVAKSLVEWTTSSDLKKGSLRNVADLVGKFTGGTSSTNYTFSGFASTLTGPLGGQGSAGATIKQQRECVMHALADSGTTRTWNLLIDLVAQTGQMSTAASRDGMRSFVVNGERHIWVSVAIDRATGKVIKMQTEPVRL